MNGVLRISRAQFDPANADRVDTLHREARAQIWAKQERLAGYRGGHVGIDRGSGVAVWATFWDTADQGNALGSLPEMMARGAKLRSQGVTFEPVASYELIGGEATT